MIWCRKLEKEAPGLEKPPFDGQLGAEIHEHVSAEAWEYWKEEMMIKVINEYRLNLADAADYEIFLEQMKVWLNLPSSGEGTTVEVENPKRAETK